ncbi:hypothetical protein [Streptomyces sp. NPDC002187]|uniref:hypothetical protein n=1 Tax=Streptomyces sp. NPDC002187 TaxID=3364637 RepID=UPI0036BC3B85
MLTYQDVITVNLSPLGNAAVSWDQMADGFEELGDAYGSGVLSVATDGHWYGVSGSAADKRFLQTGEQFDAAVTEARAIASILRDIQGQLADRIKALRDLVASAKDADLYIDAQGQAHVDPSKDKNKGTTGGIFGDAMLRAAHEASWTAAVAAAVQAVDDADQGAKLALHDAAGIKSFFEEFLDSAWGGGHGFNADAVGDIEVVEAREAKEYADEILAGEKPSDPAEYARLMRDNSGDKVFTQTYLNSLGPDNVLKLSNKMDDLAYFDDTKNKSAYLQINGGLSDSLATATRVPDFKDANGKELRYGTEAYNEAFKNWSKTGDAQFYNKWREGLREVGDDKYDVKVVGDKIAVGTGHGQEARGYQSLVTLMEQGSGYSPQFVADITDDMIATEKKDPDIWDLHGKFEGEKDGRFANDPVDGALNIMSRDPDGATAYLDPGADGKNDRLEYLLKERDWDSVNTTEWMGNIERTGDDTTDAEARKGLAAALEAGATGQEPGTPLGKPEPHSEGQARVMQSTIALLDKGAAGDTVHENLKVPLGRALNDYTADTHAILGGYAPNSPVGQDHVAGSGESASITNSKESVLRVMRGVSDGVIGTNASGDDVRVFDSLYEGQRRYAAEYLETGQRVPQSSLTENVTDWDVRSRRVGEAFGGMNAIGTDMVLDNRDTEVGKINDQARYGYHGFGALANTIPVVGDVAQRSVDAATYEWSKDVITEKENIARADVSKETANGIAGTNNLIDSWADTRDAKNSPAAENAKGEAKQSYITGREEAYSALRTRK